MSSTPPQPPDKDWSATQYLKFRTERTRPVYDLVSQITPLLLQPPSTSASTSSSSQTTRKLRIHDLGCGPGNSTQVLYDTFPGARITGMDSSADMLSKARATFANLDTETVDFVHGDLTTYTLPSETNLLFSNAVFHWLPSALRLLTLTRLFTSLPANGILAIQIPDNYHAPTHTLMRLTASLPGTPWSSYFADTRIGDISDRTRPDLDPIEPAGEWYNALSPFARGVNVWRTEYMHVLDDVGGIVEWVKGTGLQPYLNRIGDDEGARRGFLEEYEKRLKEAYPVLGDGKVMLGYPRLFVVAVRK